MFKHSFGMLFTSKWIGVLSINRSRKSSYSFRNIGINELIDFLNISCELINCFTSTFWLFNLHEYWNRDINRNIIFCNKWIRRLLKYEILHRDKISNLCPRKTEINTWWPVSLKCSTWFDDSKNTKWSKHEFELNELTQLYMACNCLFQVRKPKLFLHPNRTYQRTKGDR